MSPTHISIVIPTFNRPALLNRAICSVIQQKSPTLSLEVIVVDDCSENPVDLQEFSDEAISYTRLDQNSGPQIARNTGINMASGEWVLMLDDDDELMPGTLSQAIKQIEQIGNYRDYPVFFFATTKGSIPLSYQLIRPADLMDNTLAGDFTPILQRELFLEHRLSYLDFPEIQGVGCERLTWLEVSSRFGIPAFMTKLVQVNHDAPMRLSSYDNFIRNSYKFALQQDITIDFVKQHGLDAEASQFVEKKTLGAAIYYLVSGNKETSRERLRSLVSSSPTSRLLSVLSYLPAGLSRFLFLAYKKAYGNA